MARTPKLSNHHLAVLADLAYPQKGGVKSAEIYRSLGYEVFEVLEESTDTECYLLSNNESCVVVFAGTESFTDLLIDLRFYRKGGVHAGVYKAVNSVIDEINIVLLSFKAEFKDLYFTGHSLGGGCAVYASQMCLFDTYKVVTFGAMKVGGRSFAKSYKWQNETIQYQNTFDVIPKMQWLKKHVGKIKKSGGGGHSMSTYLKNINPKKRTA